MTLYYNLTPGKILTIHLWVWVSGLVFYGLLFLACLWPDLYMTYLAAGIAWGGGGLDQGRIEGIGVRTMDINELRGKCTWNIAHFSPDADAVIISRACLAALDAIKAERRNATHSVVAALKRIEEKIMEAVK